MSCARAYMWMPVVLSATQQDAFAIYLDSQTASGRNRIVVKGVESSASSVAKLSTDRPKFAVPLAGQWLVECGN
jgi:hypothetical protein